VRCGISRSGWTTRTTTSWFVPLPSTSFKVADNL
jgi:hypothetical protein